MLCANTVDFKTFTPARTWINRGYSVIDTTVIESQGTFYRSSKDELSIDSSSPDAKFITAERSGTLDGAEYSLVATGIGGNELVHGEGPIIVPGTEPDSWFLFIDEFDLRRYTAFTTNSLESKVWTPIEAAMPPGASHGSILPLTVDE